MDQQSKTLEQLTEGLIEELGIQNESPEAQAYLMEKLGRNIFARITAEVLHIVPEEKHAEFQNLMGSGDMKALHDFLKPHIPNFDMLVQTEARKEIEQVKQFMQEELAKEGNDQSAQAQENSPSQA